MKWHVLEKSKCFRQAAYVAKKKLLFVSFRRDGMIYCYKLIPGPLWKAFLAAESKGRYFNREVLKRFKHERIGRYLVEM